MKITILLLAFALLSSFTLFAGQLPTQIAPQTAFVGSPQKTHVFSFPAKAKGFFHALKKSIVHPKDGDKQKSFLITLLLAIFFGQFGAHRFYLGKKGTAITMLCLGLLGTLCIVGGALLLYGGALFGILGGIISVDAFFSIILLAYILGYVLSLASGIWSLIDIIRIATGSLKPADGSEYSHEKGF